MVTYDIWKDDNLMNYHFLNILIDYRLMYLCVLKLKISQMLSLNCKLIHHILMNYLYLFDSSSAY